VAHRSTVSWQGAASLWGNLRLRHNIEQAQVGHTSAVRSPTLTPTEYPQSLQTHSCGLHQARRTTGGSNTRQLVASRPSELRQSDWRSPVVEPNYGSGSMLSPGSPSSPYSGNQNRMPGSPPAPMSPPPGGGQQHGGGSSIGTDAPIMCYRRGHQFVPVEEEYNQRRVRPRGRE